MPPSLRFVILEHDHPHPHWDLMLDVGDVLRTWRLPSAPSAGDMIAERIVDHRRAYLDYEGPISGNRGTVKRWDQGTYSAHESAVDLFDIELMGENLRGRVHMFRSDGANWRLTWSLE